MQRKVGSYALNGVAIDMYLRDGRGAEFWSIYESGKPPRIQIGAHGTWREVTARLLHESMELSLSMLSCRFEPDTRGSDAANYLFVARHDQFTAACENVGDLLAACLPDVAKAWKRWK